MLKWVNKLEEKIVRIKERKFTRNGESVVAADIN